MTKGLVRYQQAGDIHFVAFSCYGRRPYFASPAAKEFFEASLEKMRRKYGFAVPGYVVNRVCERQPQILRLPPLRSGRSG
jgi:putative transposase